MPHISNFQTLSFYPDNVGVRGRDMPEYSSPTVDSQGRVYWLVKGPALVAIDADGGIPYDTFLGPKLLTSIKDVRLAGENYLYWSELPEPGGEQRRQIRLLRRPLHRDRELQESWAPISSVLAQAWPWARPQQGYFRQALTNLARARTCSPFVTAARPWPRGLVYVADPPANRVVAFKEADGFYAG